VLSDDGGQLGVELVRVDYPAEQVAAEMREVGLPDELADKLVAAA
jgi:hypothetical protein